MRTIRIIGLTNPAHVIRAFLRHEYAFAITYPEHEVRIGFRKGTWYLAKTRPHEVLDYIEIGDSFLEYRGHGKMALALYGELLDDALRKNRGEPVDREKEAAVIEKFLRVWGGHLGSIEGIMAIQPGRNSSVDEVTGEFHLAPREEEFHD